MSTLRFCFTFLIVAFATLLIGLHPAQAHTIANEPPGFSPSLLISDADFLRSNSMTATDINNFFVSKGSWLANYVIPEYIDVPYFCKDGNGNNVTQTVSVRQWHVNNFPLYGMTVASLLADRAAVNGLNPEVMLVLLERESSAISRSSPSSTMTQAWPIFYGFDETLASYGYDCATAQQKASDFGGLGQQIAYGTFGIKKNYTDSTDWNNPLTIDGVTFTPESRATRALYRYTPHIHNGNHNFWYFYTTWFGTEGCLPGLSLIKGSTDTIYLQREGVKYRIPDLGTLYAWGLSCEPVSTLDDTTIDTYSNGPALSRLVKAAGSDKIYVYVDGVRRHIRSGGYLPYFGMSNEPLIELPAPLINSTIEGAPVGYLVKATDKPEIYLSFLNFKVYVPDIPTIEAWGFTLDELTSVNNANLAALPTYGTLTVLVKGPGPEIYVASDRRFVYIPSLQRVRDWALQNTAVTYVDGPFIDSLPRNATLTQVTKGTGDPVYYISAGKRYHLATASAAARYDAQYGPLVYMANTLISRVPLAGSYQ
jgi:hypothetical protein